MKMMISSTTSMRYLSIVLYIGCITGSINLSQATIDSTTSSTSQQQYQQYQQQQPQQIQTNGNTNTIRRQTRTTSSSETIEKNHQQIYKLKDGGNGMIRTGITSSSEIKVLYGNDNHNPTIPNILQAQLKNLRKEYSSSTKSIATATATAIRKENTITLHVGPMKTGTSSLQHLLLKERDVLLELDQYETITHFFKQYKGVNNEAFVQCFMPTNRLLGNGCSTELNTSIYEVGSIRHHDFVMTAEGFYHPDLNLQQMKHYMTSGWSHYQIIMNYRRYYDWLLSFHNQASKVQEPPKRVSIVEYVTRLYKQKIMNETVPLDSYYVIDEYKRYSQYFENIHIIPLPDLHRNNRSLEEEFLCHLVPNATQSCQHFLTENRDLVIKEKKNTHHSLVYEELAYYAREMNLWMDRDNDHDHPVETTTTTAKQSTPLNLKTVTALVRNHHEVIVGKKEQEFDVQYIECVSEEVLDWLLYYSFDAEELLFPDLFYDYGRHEMIKEFHDPDYRSKFCHVNAKFIMEQDPTWRSFFQSL